MEKITIENLVNKMEEVLSKTNKQSEVPWIITKVLRINMKQYEFINEVTSRDFDRCIDACNKVNEGQSVADIFGLIEFYGNHFNVVRDVFYPRLSTECLINAVKDNFTHLDSVLDVCSGSGCISITLSQIFGANTLGVDISSEAVRLAGENAKKFKTNSSFVVMDVKQDWGKVINKKYEIIVSNPPYWTHEQLRLNADKIRNNPQNACDGGETGLEFYEVIIKNAPNYLIDNGMLVLEIDPVILDGVTKLLEKDFANFKIYKDHLNIDRVICAIKK